MSFVIFLFILILLSLILYFRYKTFYQYQIDQRRKVSVKQRMEKLKELYDIVIDQANLAGASVFLNYGTLLGQVRNGKIICYDYDLDFGIDKTQFSKLSTILKLFCQTNNQYVFHSFDMLGYKHMVIIDKETELNADIDGFDSNDQYIWRMIPSLYSKYMLKECSHQTPKNWIYPLKQVDFLEKKVFIPNQSDQLLACFYGHNYLTPDHLCDDHCENCVSIYL